MSDDATETAEPDPIAQHWQEIAAHLRQKLANRLPSTDTMSAADLRDFAFACREAAEFETRVAVYTERVQLEMNRGLPPE